MLIPLSTDAPIYHFPVASIGLIVVNCVAFFATGMGMADTVETWGPWSLNYGDGLHPVQWVTSNFIHMGFMHLIGNMVFLWGFGLVVEGKLGWWRYLLVYLGIGVAQCAVEQTLMLGHDPLEDLQARIVEVWEPPTEAELDEYRQELLAEGLDEDLVEQLVEAGKSPPDAADHVDQIGAFAPPGSCGASSILYGMLAISLVWAPKNEVTCLLVIFYRMISIEITIMTFAVWYIGFELLIAVLGGFSMTSALLHLMGAGAGFGVGVLLLKRNWVDCEDWDLFAVMSGHYGQWARDKHGNPIDRDSKREAPPPIASAGEKQKKKRTKGVHSDAAADRKLTELRDLIASGDFVGASDELYNLRLRNPDAQPDEPDLKALSVGLAKLGSLDEAVPLMEEYVETYPESNAMRLRLAKTQLHDLADRRAAMRTLKGIDQETLTESQASTFRKLRKLASQ